MGQDPRNQNEHYWVKLYHYFLQRGYQFRPRYHPDWIPSWGTETKYPPVGKAREDSQVILWSHVIDATRLQDGRKVVIKRGSIEEASIAQYLHSLGSAASKNRTVEILDVFSVPLTDGEVFIITPMLMRFDFLPFRQLGELTEAVHAFLKGLAFMRQHNIAHRDACQFNLYLDHRKMVPRGFHFARPTSHDGIPFKDFKWHDRWSVRPVQYYFIDFGLSARYPPGQKNIKDIGILGQDRTVPERSLDIPYDPFKMDIYQLGNAFKTAIENYEGVEWFSPLLTSMTQVNPDDRPTALEALHSFEDSLSKLTKTDLKHRIWTGKVSDRDRFWITVDPENNDKTDFFSCLCPFCSV